MGGFELRNPKSMKAKRTAKPAITLPLPSSFPDNNTNPNQEKTLKQTQAKKQAHKKTHKQTILIKQPLRRSHRAIRKNRYIIRINRRIVNSTNTIHSCDKLSRQLRFRFGNLMIDKY